MALCVLVWLTGCVDEAGVPQPQPVPDSDFIRRSTAELGQTDAQTMVVGLPGAVAGAGEVRVRRVSTGEELTASSSAAGSFSLVVGGSNEEIELRYVSQGVASEPLILPATLAAGELQLEQTRDVKSAIGPPDAAGNVTISNDSDPSPIAASADVLLVVANQRTGLVIEDQTDVAGHFTVEIAARSGDAILLMLVKPDDPGSTSDYLSLLVP